MSCIQEGNQGDIETSFDKLPNDILVQLIPLMDPSSRLNLALAYPERFLNEDPVVGAYICNMFKYDAEQQVLKHNCQTSVEEDYTKPILYAAIDSDAEISLVGKIVKYYKDECPTSISGIWGQYPAKFPPPLFFAATLGKPEVVSLLLDEGADPTSKYGNKWEGTPLTGTAFEAAIDAGFRLASQGSIKHQAIEDCALILYDRGLSIKDHVIQLRTLDLGSLVAQAVKAGFLKLTKAILDQTAHITKEDLKQYVLYPSLSVACTFQASDDYRDMIEYLLSIGAPLADPVLQRQSPFGPIIDPIQRHGPCYRFCDTHVRSAIDIGHAKTATFLLNLYVDQNIRLDFGDSSSIQTENFGISLAFVQALYRAMDREVNNSEKVERNWFHEKLLSWLITGGSKSAATEWLIGQGVSDVWHVWQAVEEKNRAAIDALLQAGHSVNTSKPLLGGSQMTLLGYALWTFDWDMACLLIRRGADVALLSEAIKSRLSKEFEHIYQMPYVQSNYAVTPDMLKPEYIATQPVDEEQIVSALCSLILG
ncbi:hypothetical protein HD806DRAFT_537741 [Xylariaceae sp. AK1471]|nr:hypothetical protein HD806DRAFT_537741 [Xylariaceae sp. AK1471]